MAAFTKAQLQKSGLTVTELAQLTGINRIRLHRASHDGYDNFTDGEREVLWLVLRAAAAVPDRLTLVTQKCVALGKVYVAAMEAKQSQSGNDPI